MSEAKLFIATVPKPIRLQNKTLEYRSSLVWRFLEKHDLITIDRLATKIGYGKANFRKYMYAKKRLPEALLLKVEKELRSYGFGI